MYEDKSTTLERIKKTVIEELPENVRSRLVLENDEVRTIFLFWTSTYLGSGDHSYVIKPKIFYQSVRNLTFHWFSVRSFWH